MFILGGERDADPVKSFQRYREYLKSVRSNFPPKAYALASSEWWYNFNEHRCPHDAWLESATLRELSSGERCEARTTELSLLLLGAYHDLKLWIVYKGVVSLNVDGPNLVNGHGDWRYDEFRVSEDGRLVHEIEWASHKDHARWIITAEDIEYDVVPVAPAA
jgi:hypothetical protein